MKSLDYVFVSKSALILHTNMCKQGLVVTYVPLPPFSKGNIGVYLVCSVVITFHTSFHRPKGNDGWASVFRW